MGVVVASYEGEDKQVYHVAGVLIDGQFYRLRIRRITPKVCRLQGLLIGQLLEKSLVIASSINAFW